MWCVCVCVSEILSSHSPFDIISLGSKLSLKGSLLVQSQEQPGALKWKIHTKTKFACQGHCIIFIPMK